MLAYTYMLFAACMTSIVEAQQSNHGANQYLSDSRYYPYLHTDFNRKVNPCGPSCVYFTVCCALVMLGCFIARWYCSRKDEQLEEDQEVADFMRVIGHYDPTIDVPNAQQRHVWNGMYGWLGWYGNGQQNVNQGRFAQEWNTCRFTDTPIAPHVWMISIRGTDGVGLFNMYGCINVQTGSCVLRKRYINVSNDTVVYYGTWNDKAQTLSGHWQVSNDMGSFCMSPRAVPTSATQLQLCKPLLPQTLRDAVDVLETRG